MWDDGEELELPFEAEVRILFMNLQVNEVANDATAVREGDIKKEKPDYGENTDFERMWPAVRENLIYHDRIDKKDIPDIYTPLWLSQKCEEIEGWSWEKRDRPEEDDD